jgi:hypothetical protein
MAKMLGGCHCGAVRFEAEADLQTVIECNCSICTKKGAIHHRVRSFTLLCGEPELTLYQFGEKIAKHHFCSRCGIHAFTNPRAAPDKTTINLRCLDDFEGIKDQIVIKPFDGRNWDRSTSDFKVD